MYDLIFERLMSQVDSVHMALPRQLIPRSASISLGSWSRGVTPYAELGSVED